MKCISAAILIFSLALTSPAAADPTIVIGSAGITDGDTIRIGKTRVRFFGIDAPEGDQPCTKPDGSSWACGAAATKALAGFIAGRPVECEGDEHDHFGRLVAVCRADGKDLGEWMVENGWAIAYPPALSEPNAARAANLTQLLVRRGRDAIVLFVELLQVWLEDAGLALQEGLKVLAHFRHDDLEHSLV